MMLQELISAEYWFGDPGPILTLTPLFVGLIVIFTGFLLVSLVIRIWVRRGNVHPAARKLWELVPGRFFRWGILGLLLLFFRFEGASYLDWRFWWLVFLGWMIWAIQKEVRFMRREWPIRKELWERRGEGKEWEVKSRKKGKKKKRK